MSTVSWHVYNPVYIFGLVQISYLHVGVFSLDVVQPTDIWPFENRVKYRLYGRKVYHENWNLVYRNDRKSSWSYFSRLINSGRERINTREEWRIGVNFRTSGLNDQVKGSNCTGKTCILFPHKIILQMYTSVLWKQDMKLIKLRGLSPQANYTDRATAVCRRS
jgi:hypothetical protein